MAARMNMQVALQSGPAIDLTPTIDLGRLAAAYPRVSCRLTHGLVGHPLLTIDALAEASQRLDPALVECRRANGRNGEEFSHLAPKGGSVAAAIRAMREAACWVMLRGTEGLQEYRALVDDILATLAPVTDHSTGKVLTPHAFIFISAPGTLTPFHFDPEFNILFQISGRKRFVVYPPKMPWLPDQANEIYHASGDNMLGWTPAFEGEGTAYTLDPGDALFVPYRSPHWVKVGDEPSISLSITWRSASSYLQDDAYRLNRWLRARGLSPRAPVELPETSRVKGLAWRVMTRLGAA